MPAAQLGRKQDLADSARWRQAMTDAAQQISENLCDELVAVTAETIRAEVKIGRRLAYGWSGGKDSQALRYVCDAAGVGECLLAMTSGLEYPAMLRWLTDHMPPGCEVDAAPIGLQWLTDHPQMLFPQGARGAEWFALIQHRAQSRYFTDNKLDALLLGRRRKDGNYVGARGQTRYTSAAGITRWSPLADWTHEQVFALIAHKGLSLPPCYDWPRGFQVGTGAWPARQWTRSVDHGFTEVYSIDPDVIRGAAADGYVPAADWLQRSGYA